MASSSLSVSPIAHLIGSGHRVPLFRFRQRDSSRRTGGIRLHAKKESSSATGETGSESENAVLRAAWYGSEILGIVASFFRSAPPPSSSASPEIEIETEEGILASVAGRAQVVEAIKQDFDRSYFVTGNLTLKAYEEDCEFADPAGSFRGLSRFKRNCTNFGSLLVKSNMKLTKWEDFEVN